MWKVIVCLLSLVVLVLAAEVRAEKGLRRGSSRIVAKKNTEGQVSSSSSSSVLPYTSISSPNVHPRQLKKDKDEDDEDEGVNIPVDDPGQTEGDTTTSDNQNAGAPEQGQQQQQVPENTPYDDSTLEQLCSSVSGSDSPMTTENSLSVQYEYRLFTDQAGDPNAVLGLGNEVNRQVALHLRQIYIGDFCDDYLAGGGGATRARGLSPGDVRAVVPGNTALLDGDCDDAAPWGAFAGAPCVRLQSSVAVHFAPDYVMASPDDVGATILADVSAAFQSGGLAADSGVAGAAYTAGSLGTVADEPPQNATGGDGGEDNNSQGDDSNGDNSDRGNVAGSEQGAANADDDDDATIVVKDKMSRAGKFFLTVFILGLIGGLIYAVVKLRRVEKSHSFEDYNSARGDGSGGGGKFAATVDWSKQRLNQSCDWSKQRLNKSRDWFKQRLNKSRGEEDDRGGEKIGRAETDDDDEGTMEVELRNDRSQTSISNTQSEPKLKAKAKSWLAAIKNGIFDSERAERIPRAGTPKKALSTSMDQSGFSVYGKEDKDGIASNLSYATSGDIAGHLSALFSTSTLDASMTDQGDGTEVILDDLQQQQKDSAKKKNTSSRRFTPSTLPSNDEKNWSGSKKEEIDNNTSTWSYDEKNFSLSDIQILVDDASTDAGSMQYSRRTYYMPDTVQL